MGKKRSRAGAIHFLAQLFSAFVGVGSPHYLSLHHLCFLVGVVGYHQFDACVDVVAVAVVMVMVVCVCVWLSAAPARGFCLALAGAANSCF